MSKSKRWLRPGVYLGMGVLFLILAIDLVRSGKWWAVPFLMLGFLLFAVVFEISLLIFRILTTDISFAIGRDVEYSWGFHFSLGKIIYTILLLLLRRWRGLTNIRVVDAAWSGMKAGASVRAPNKQPRSIAGSGRIIEAGDE